MKKSLEQKIFPYLLVLPTLLIFGVFLFIPAISGLMISFTEWDGLNEQVFVGVANYIELFQDKAFWDSFVRTIIYSFITVPLLYVVALGLGLLLVQNIRGKGFFRAVFYWPTMISAIIVGLSWKFILGEDFGILNYILVLLGGEPVKWLTNQNFAMATVIFVTIWSLAGFYMVMFISGLNSISESYYEAADIDGASPVQKFKYITFPLLKPTSLLVLVLSVIAVFKSYPLVFALTEGGPGSSTKFMVQMIYETGFQKNDLGYACAMTVVLFIVLSIFTLIQFKLNKGGEQDV